MVSVGDLKRRIPAEGYASVDLSLPEFKRLALDLGRPVSARRRGPTVDRLTPTRSVDAAPRSLSAQYGTGAFPFHTDAAHHALPPRYVLLRLADGARTTTPTLLAVIDLAALSPQDRRTLTREQWLVNGGRGRVFYSPILDPRRQLIRFDPGCMSEPGGTTLQGHEIVDAAKRSDFRRDGGHLRAEGRRRRY